MPDDTSTALEVSGIDVTTRVTAADGSVVQHSWDDSGAIRTRRWTGSGDEEPERIGGFGRDGSYGFGEEPDRVDRSANPYGGSVERAHYDDGTVVEHRFDDDVRLDRVRVHGLWGSQEMDLRPDGSRSLTWRTGGLGGRRTWDASGNESSSVHEVEPDLDR